MTAPRGVTEDDIHAYVDGALTPARRLAFEHELASSPETAQRVEAFVRQRAALRGALAPVAVEPIPETLNLARLMEGSGRRPVPVHRGWVWQSAAAAVLLALGGVGGWWARAVSEPPATGLSALVGEAAATYTAYAGDFLQASTATAGDDADLLRWIADRLHRPVAAPDLSALGFRFTGGRLVATQNGPAGMFTYDGEQGTHIIVLTRPMAVDGTAPMRRDQRNGTEILAWTGGGMGFGVAGPANANGLSPVADEVRRQVEGKV